MLRPGIPFARPQLFSHIEIFLNMRSHDALVLCGKRRKAAMAGSRQPQSNTLFCVQAPL
jgi:hypothetical protein